MAGEFLTSNRYIRYPIVDDTKLYIDESVSDSSGSNLEELDDSLAKFVFGCFIDAFIQIKSAFSTVKPAITGIRASSSTLYFTIKDLYNSENEDITLSCTRSATTFPVIRGYSSWCWYVFVISSEGIAEYCEQASRIGNIATNHLFLNSHCIGQSDIGVSSLWIYGGKGTDSSGNRYTRTEALLHDPDAILSGDVLIKPGYNMQFRSGTNGFELNAIAGAGLGIAPCEQQETCITFKTEGLLSPDGHTRLFNTTCYDLVPDRIDDSSGYLYMHAKCIACCTCDMYASIVNDRLIPLKDKVLQLKDILDSINSTYEQNVTSWNTSVNTVSMGDIMTSITGVALDAAGTDLTGDIDVHGKMSRCGITILIRNNSFVNVRVHPTSAYANGEVFEMQLSYTDKDGNPVVSQLKSMLFTIVLPPGHSCIFTYFIRLSDLVPNARQTGFLTNVRLRFYDNNRNEIGERTVSLTI